MDRHDFVQTPWPCKALAAQGRGARDGPTAEGHACAADAYLVWQRATEALAEIAAALATDPRCYEAKVAEGRAYEFALDAARSEAAYRAALAHAADGRGAARGPGPRALEGGQEGRRGRRAAQGARARPERSRRALRAGRRARSRRPRASASSSTRRASAPRSPRPGWRSGGKSSPRGTWPQRRDAADAAVKSDPGSVAALVLVGQGRARGGTGRRRAPGGPGGAEDRRQLRGGQAARGRRQRAQGRDRSGARGLPGGLGPRSRRPRAARPREPRPATRPRATRAPGPSA